MTATIVTVNGLALTAGGPLRRETAVSADGAQLFSGRNVLFTLPKNNDPA